MKKTISFVAAVAVSAMLVMSACHSDEGAQNVPQAPSQPVPNQPNTQNR